MTRARAGASHANRRRATGSAASSAGAARSGAPATRANRQDPRRESAFSIFYMGINIGSFFSPIIVGAVRAVWGYHAAFSVAAIGMGIALVFFVLGRKNLQGAGDIVPNPVQPGERPALVRMFAIILGAVVVVYLIAVLVAGGWGVHALIDALSYIAFLAPIAFFITMYRSPRRRAPRR